MTKFFQLEAMVPGWIGEQSVSKIIDNREVFEKVHYVFDDYPTDCIVERCPIYLVNEDLKRALETLGATGCQFDDAIITESDSYQGHTSSLTDNSLPRFSWLKILGEAGSNDIGIRPPRMSIVISARVLELMRALGLHDCIVYSWPETGDAGTHISKF